MLLNFKITNFRSFKNETVFTMIPSNKKTHNDYIIRRNTPNGEVKALPSAVIYGANASGKSNIILAMYILKEIVAAGGLQEKKTSQILSILSFIHDEDFYEPSKFEITFSQGENVYRYGLSILSRWGEQSIIEEELFINGDMIYSRTEQNGVTMNIQELIKKGHLDNGLVSFYQVLLSKINETLDSKQLFLFSGIKNLINNDYYNDIMNWFSRFKVVMNANDIEFKHKDLEILNKNKENLADVVDREIYISASIEELVSSAEFGRQQIRFISDADGEGISMLSVYHLPEYKEDKNKPNGLVLSSELIESKGTLQLIRLIQPFIDALKTGGVVILDEMDASLHFEIVVSLIRVFNSKELNVKGAQLIFNTHNPVYLDGKLFRHDQIVMVEKDRESLRSELYSLADFNLRPEERILKNYLDGKYGALPHMDLEIAFKHILQKEFEKDGETEGENA